MGSTGIGRRAVVVLLLAGVVFATVPGVVAAETRSGGAVVVERGETVREDLQAFGGTIEIRGTVDGDVEAVGGTVVIAGTGVVTGDVAATGGTVVLEDGARVGGDVEAAGGTVTVDGTVDGGLSVGAGTVTIDGTVGGDARVGGDTIRLGPDAEIGGDLEYDGTLTRAPGATVAGTVTQSDDLVAAPDAGPGPIGPGPIVPPWAPIVYGMFANLALGVVLLFALPRFSREVAGRIAERPLRSGGIGLLTLVAVPIALVLVALTIIGIPLTLLGALLFAALVWIGAVYGRFAVGAWLLSLVGVENRWAGLLLGVVGVGIVTLVPVGGGVVEFVVLALGLGALADAVYERWQARRRTTPSPTADGRETI